MAAYCGCGTDSDRCAAFGQRFWRCAADFDRLDVLLFDLCCVYERRQKRCGRLHSGASDARRAVRPADDPAVSYRTKRSRVGGFRHADFSHGCRGGHVPADRAVRELREAGSDGRHGTFAVPVADLRHCLQHHPARKNGARAIHHLLLHLGGTASVYRRDDVPGAAGKAGRNTEK